MISALPPAGVRRRRPPWPAGLALLLCLLSVPMTALADGAKTTDPSAASALLESSRPEEALELLDEWLARRPKDARALLLRSTAHFMLGNLSQGTRDLDLSIQLDPGNRQAWLNRAALEVADADYASALEAFRRAESLEPSAADNSLNIGTVLLLLDRFGEARDRFKDYLARNPRDPEARYLVASNYAMRGFAQPAVANLARAIALDEKMRRAARIDPNFAPLFESAEFLELLRTDNFRPAAGSMITTQSYERPYLGGQSAVLDAVIGSLQLAGRAFDPQVEVTSRWALVWSDMRIKVSDNGSGGTELLLSAPPGRFSADRWRAVTEELLRGVKVQLHTRGRSEGGR